MILNCSLAPFTPYLKAIPGVSIPSLIFSSNPFPNALLLASCQKDVTY